MRFPLMPLLAWVAFACGSNEKSQSSNIIFNETFLEKTIVHKVYVDSDGIIYASCYDGLYFSADKGISWTQKTNADGLASTNVLDTVVSDDHIYAATAAGLTVSKDKGLSFEILPISNSFIGVYTVKVAGPKVYAGTNRGLYLSVDGGLSFERKSNIGNLDSDNLQVNDLHVADSSIYAATNDGLIISHDNGVTFSVKNNSDGLGSTEINSIWVENNAVYAATENGLSVSKDGGQSFENTVPSNISADFNDVVLHDSILYAAVEGGVVVSRDDGITFEAFTKVHGLQSDSVFSLFIHNNDLYAGTLKGFSVARFAE